MHLINSILELLKKNNNNYFARYTKFGKFNFDTEDGGVCNVTQIINYLNYLTYAIINRRPIKSGFKSGTIVKYQISIYDSILQWII